MGSEKERDTKPQVFQLRKGVPTAPVEETRPPGQGRCPSSPETHFPAAPRPGRPGPIRTFRPRKVAFAVGIAASRCQETAFRPQNRFPATAGNPHRGQKPHLPAPEGGFSGPKNRFRPVEGRFCPVGAENANPGKRLPSTTNDTYRDRCLGTGRHRGRGRGRAGCGGPHVAAVWNQGVDGREADR